MEQKKSIEFNFVTFVILIVILLIIVFVIARNTGNIPEESISENNIEEEQQEIEDKPSKIYANNVIILDEAKLTENWKIVEEGYGSIVFFIQGPKSENEDGTFSDIRINIYIQQSEMTNEDLKKQMLENSIYSKIEYTKMQEINSFQWMEFEAENKGVKAKILAIMKDGYMYAAEINGEEKLYDEYYNEAMKILMTIKIADRIPLETAQTVIYDYDNLANIKEGGTKYLLTSLNLPVTEDQKEEYEDYLWTGIKYSDFANEMKKYMTEEVLKSKFEEFIEYKDKLFVKDVKGTQREYMIEEITPIEIRGNETIYEVKKTRMDTFETIKEKITLKLENDKCVVSNVE